MTMEWNDSRVSYAEHNESMKRFRKAHANIAWSNQPKCNELARLDSMLPLEVTYPLIETGGSRFHSGTTNWSTLVPVFRVASYKLSSN